MEARYVFFKQLDLNEKNKFEIDLSRDSIVEILNFHPAESIL